MPAIAVLAPAPAGAVLRRTLARRARLIRCRGADALRKLCTTRLVDAIVLSPLGNGLPIVQELQKEMPGIPVVVWAPFRAEDAETLSACREAGAAIVVQGVDDAVAGDIVGRSTLAAERGRALADAPRVLRLTEPLQRRVWELVVREVECPLRTSDIARKLRVGREHLSRQFGAGGAPNLKRVIDLTRVACAAQLLRNPRMPPQVVASVLNFASPSHLNMTAQRIAATPAAGLRDLGPEGVLAGFVHGRTRSREV